ncbi:MAG: CHAT domain-containing protein [Pyrinomonadaceae bacterium]|nr:CHAT domain-containing protein [Phycisphaerales bacterium]
MNFFATNQSLIHQFFAIDDGRKRHPEVTGQLYQVRLLPPYEPDAGQAAPNELTALKVGAAACRMVELDVLYSLREGRAVMRLTQALFNDLKQQLVTGEWNNEARQFGDYALIRWANAAGRIFYRNKDWPQAVSWMQAAADHSEASQMSLHADVVSDYSRALFERTNGSAQHEKGCEKAAGTMVEALARFIENPNVTVANLGAALDELAFRIEACTDTEKLKGVGNLLHNLQLIGGNWRSSKPEPAEIARIKPRLLALASRAALRAGDEYRLEQIGHADARQEMALDPGAITRQRAGLARMSRRNALIRRQNIALALADRAKAHDDASAREQAKQELYRMLADLRLQRERLGPDYFDHDVHGYVLAHLTKPQNQLLIVTDNTDFASPDWDLLLTEYRDLAESHRGLTSLARYKAELTAFVIDRMRETAGIQMRRVLARLGNALDLSRGDIPRDCLADFEPIIDAVELSSCRELLDVISMMQTERPGRPVRNSSALRHDLFMRTTGKRPPMPDLPRDVGTGRTMGVSLLENQDPDPALATLGLCRLAADEPLADHRPEFQEKRMIFEKFTATWEVPPVAHVADVLHRALMYTRSEPSTFIIRYVEADVPGAQGVTRELFAFVMDAGKLSMYPCGPIQHMHNLLSHPWHNDRVFPSVNMARDIYTRLLKPIRKLKEVLQPGASSPRRRLVIVPSPKLWGVPFHAAIDDKSDPLLLRTPMIVTTSLSSFCAKNAGSADSITVEAEDDLISLCSLKRSEAQKFSGLTSWMNDVPLGIQLSAYGGGAPTLHRDSIVMGSEAISWDEFRRTLQDRQPEFFVWITHGIPGEKIGALQFRPNPDVLKEEVIYPLDLLDRQFLPRNKLTVLTACMGAQWESGGDEAEISGFIRGFRGAGAAVILAAQWQIGVKQAGDWLAKLATRMKPGASWNASDAAHEISLEVASSETSVAARLASCVFCPFI